MNIYVNSLCWAVLLIATVDLAGSAVKPVSISTEDIASAVSANRATIHDIAVEFTFDALNPPRVQGYVGARFHAKVTVKGLKTAIRTEFGAASDVDPRTFATEAAYNGTRTTTYSGTVGTAIVMTDHPRESKTQGLAFFDFAMLNPQKPNGRGVDDQNLISALTAAGSRLRPQMETVGSTQCYVLDVSNPITRRPELTLWLDPMEGFLPIRQQFLLPDGSVGMEFRTEKAVEVEGVWLPVLGRKLVYVGPHASRNAPMVSVLEVVGVRQTAPALAVNRGVDDAYFDLWTRLPMGTAVWDRDNNKLMTVGGANFATLGASVRDNLAARTGGGVAVGRLNESNRGTSWAYRMAGGVVLVIVAALAAVIAWRRRRARRT